VPTLNGISTTYQTAAAPVRVLADVSLMRRYRRGGRDHRAVRLR
jgi:hypothetical protein